MTTRSLAPRWTESNITAGYRGLWDSEHEAAIGAREYSFNSRPSLARLLVVVPGEWRVGPSNSTDFVYPTPTLGTVSNRGGPEFCPPTRAGILYAARMIGMWYWLER